MAAFCMITSFFGRYSFGGDATYVDHLTRALLRRGHEVDVIHSVDAFTISRDNQPLRAYEPPAGLRIHSLRNRGGRWSTLLSHQTGRPVLERAWLKRILARKRFDVVHFHNISLMGGPAVLRLGSGLRIMTAHEHWLVCPLSLLWKNGRDVCDRPTCVRCSLRAGRPVQWWRYSPLVETALTHLDALIFPSRNAMEQHQSRGVGHGAIHLPYFVPERERAALPDREHTASPVPRDSTRRPYFAAAGRLVREKGFHTIIPAMDAFPDVDLKIAGSGPFEPTLRRLARNRSNVSLLGQLSSGEVGALFRDAVALIVPSLFYETFGYVLLEAFAVGTPAIVRRRGALPEVIGESGAGLTFQSPEDLVAAMGALLDDGSMRDTLGRKGLDAVRTRWSETAHIATYFELLENLARKPLTEDSG